MLTGPPTPDPVHTPSKCTGQEAFMPNVYLELVAVHNGHNAIQEACGQAGLWNFPLGLPLLHCCSQLFPFLSAHRSCCVSSPF